MALHITENIIPLYTLTFHSKKEYSDCKNLFKKYNVVITSSIDEIYTIQIKGHIQFLSFIKHLKTAIISRSCKSRILKNIPKEINENTQPQKIQWDVLRTTNNYSTYKKSKGSHSHCVALIDSGIDVNHCDLTDNIISVKNFVPENENNICNNGECKINPLDMRDHLDHGTQVAGQICANGEILSIAPNTGIKVYKVFGKNLAYNIWIIKAIICAANDGVDVINLSLGSYLLTNYYKKNNQWENNHAELIAVSYTHL